MEDKPPELENSSESEGETLRIKSESANTKRSRPRAVQRETSCDLGDHNLTHFPKDPRCEICNDCKIQSVYCRKQKHGPPDEYATPEKFGDFITADHAVLAPEEASRKGYRYTLVVLDRYSSWLQGYAALTKDAHETKINATKIHATKTCTKPRLHRWRNS